jgi:hypothetical protein
MVISGDGGGRRLALEDEGERKEARDGKKDVRRMRRVDTARPMKTACALAIRLEPGR